MLQVEVQQVSEIRVSWCYDNRRCPATLHEESHHGRGTPLHVGAAIVCAQAQETARKANALHSLLPAVLGTWRRPSMPLSPVKGSFVCVGESSARVARAWQSTVPPACWGPPEEGAVSSCGWKTRQPHFLPSSGKEMGYK